MSSADRADSSDRTRPSTNASSENASSPRRRRNKGPAPKPPMTQCSSSPLSTTCNNVSTSCPSSVPPSPTNSSVVTSHSASSKSHLVLTSKSPAPLPPHLTRSLSEQKQLNMKNLINATHTFRSEVNLIQDAQSSAHSDAEQHSLPDELQLQLRENEENIVLVYEEGYSAQLIEKRNKQTTVAVTTTTTTADSQNHHHHHHHRHHHHHHDHQNRKAVTIKEDDTIYETPLPIKSLLADGGEILPPDLPTKTFDPLKMFGCRYNEETRRLERVVDADTGDGSTGMPRSLSMPVSQFTCCLHHWKEYLNALAKTDPAMMACNVQKDTETQSSNLKTAAEVSVKALPSNVHDCDCEHYHECLPASDLMNALLSPQHSLRYKKSRHDAALKKHAISPEHSANLGDHDPVPFSSFERCEFIRALSDGSLTNTSTATVVEFINEDSSNGDGAPVGSNLLMDDAGSGGCGGVKSGNGGKQHQQPNISNGSESLRSAVNQKCLSDVFCQTTFEDAPERPARRYKNHKYSCRCRHLKATRAHQGQSRHCRHRHCSAHHGECCSSVAAPAAAYFAGNDILRQAAVSSRNNVWLTSSTSDHSLSSSTSTLSEASTMRTSSTLSNDVSNCKAAAAAAALGHLCSTSTMSPFGEPLVRFPHDNDGGFYSNTDTTLAEILSGRSPISTERLFKSAENNFPPPLVEAESGSEFGSAFDPVQQLKSSSTPLANIFQELDTDVFLNTAESIPCKVNHEETQNNKCLMTELEMAIACGNHQRAAILAKELAIKRAHCSLTNKQYSGGGTGTIIKEKPARTSPIVAYLYIEERTTHRGPIPFQVYPSMSVNMLKLKVEKEFNIPSELQKWVLGRNIATNLSAALSTYGITNSGCPIFLYVLPSPQSAGAFSTLTSLVSMNKQSLVGEVAIKTNGNVSSDDDNIYESLRAPPPVLIPFPPYTESSSESSTLNRKSKVKSAGSSNKESADGCSGQPGNLAYFPATDNGAVGADSVQLVSNETSAHQLSQTTSQNSVKSYYYQEGEVQFANQLVFEGLSMVNELLPRVEEEDEDDLEEFEKEEKQLDEESDLMARNINGISELALATLNQVTTAAVSTYQKLVELEDVKCVRNIESFECPICFGRFKPGEGVVLRECLHTFCRDCLKGTIEYNEEVQVKCPFRDDLYSCDCALQDREIKELASSETYERYLKKSVSVAEKNVEKSFHCKSADCPGKG